MATTKKANKKRVSKNTKRPALHLTIWAGVLVVLIVAVVGVAVVRFSEASIRPAWPAKVWKYDEKNAPWEVVDNIIIDRFSDNSRKQFVATYHFWYAGDRTRDGAKVWWSVGSGKCVTITPENSFKEGVYNDHNYYQFERVTVWEQNPDECRLRTPNRT